MDELIIDLALYDKIEEAITEAERLANIKIDFYTIEDTENTDLINLGTQRLYELLEDKVSRDTQGIVVFCMSPKLKQFAIIFDKSLKSRIKEKDMSEIKGLIQDRFKSGNILLGLEEGFQLIAAYLRKDIHKPIDV